MILFGHMNPRVTNHFRLASGLGSTGPQASVVEFGAFLVLQFRILWGSGTHCNAFGGCTAITLSCYTPSWLSSKYKFEGFGFRFLLLHLEFTAESLGGLFPFAPCLPFFRGEGGLGQAGLGWASAICRWLRGWGRRLKLTFFFFGGGRFKVNNDTQFRFMSSGFI